MQRCDRVNNPNDENRHNEMVRCTRYDNGARTWRHQQPADLPGGDKQVFGLLTPDS